MPDELNGTTNGAMNGATPAPAAPATPSAAYEASHATAPPTAPSGPSGVLDYFKGQGVNLSDEIRSDEDAIKALYHAAVNPDPRLVQLANHGRQYVAWQQSDEGKRYQDWMKTQGQPQPKSADPSEAAWAVLEHKQGWQSHIEEDPRTGELIPRRDNPYASPQAVAEANAYRAASQQRLRDMVNNPRDYFKRAYEPHFKEFADSLETKFEDYLRRRETAAGSRAYLQQNFQDIYATDERGQILRDPYTGREQLKPQGALLNYYLDQGRGLMGIGPQDEVTPEQWERLQRFALERTHSDTQTVQAWREHEQQLRTHFQGAATPAASPPATPPPPTPAERNADAKARTLATAAASRKRNPGSGTSGNRRIATAAESPDMPPRLRDIVLANIGA